MARGVILALLVANVALGIWAVGMGRTVSWNDGAGGPTEPERLAQQVRPESVRVVPPADTQSAAAPVNSVAPPATVPASAPAAGPGPALGAPVGASAASMLPPSIGSVPAAPRSASGAIASPPPVQPVQRADTQQQAEQPAKP